MIVTSFAYKEDGIQEFDDIEKSARSEGVTWINIDDITINDIESDNILKIRNIFNIHYLSIEDIVENSSQPKTEEFDDHTFVLFKTASLSQKEVEFEKETTVNPIGFFIGEDWLVTISTTRLEVIEKTIKRFSDISTQPRKREPDFITYKIIDNIVDNYFKLLNDIGDEIQKIEDNIISETDPKILERINNVRRDLLAFRKTAWPSREAMAYLSRGGARYINDQNEKYFRDIYDHLVQVVDLIETYRDLTNGSRDIYLSSVSLSTNEVMKVLTIVATIFIPLTFIAGIYGMNFTGSKYNMPELEWTFGYPAVMLGMGFLAAIMLIYFKKRDWI